MSLGWLIIIAVVIVFLIYEAIHRFLIKRATLIVRRRAQSVTDQIVITVLNDVVGLTDYHQPSKLVSDIWGKGVFSFEYNLDSGVINNEAIGKLSRDKLEKALNKEAHRRGIEYYPQAKQAFKITDWWQGKRHFHMDVTYLMNEASFEYVHDLKKLNES